MLIKARLDEGDETATTWTGLCSSKIMIFPLSATPLLPPLHHCPLHRPRYRLYCSLRCDLLVLFHPPSISPLHSFSNEFAEPNESFENRIGTFIRRDTRHPNFFILPSLRNLKVEKEIRKLNLAI